MENSKKIKYTVADMFDFVIFFEKKSFQCERFKSFAGNYDFLTNRIGTLIRGDKQPKKNRLVNMRAIHEVSGMGRYL